MDVGLVGGPQQDGGQKLQRLSRASDGDVPMFTSASVPSTPSGVALMDDGGVEGFGKPDEDGAPRSMVLPVRSTTARDRP
jgi:hypothetical protein